MNRPAPKSNDSPVPPHWAHAIVLESLHCRQCGYDLRGLRADSRCPECGLEIWTSILHTVDPAASRLPSLRNPRAVGDALFVIALCLLVGMLMLLTQPIGELIDNSIGSSLGAWSMRVPILNWTSTLALIIVTLWAVHKLAPPRGAEPHGTVWKDIWRITFGMVGALTFGRLWVNYSNEHGELAIKFMLAMHFLAACFATLGLFGLRGVLRVIGQRSREYRRSQGGRQNVELIIAAIAAGFIGSLLFNLTLINALPRSWSTPARALLWVSNFMVLIGLAYLVMNVLWIRSALRKPPPPLDQVLSPNLPADTWIPDRDE